MPLTTITTHSTTTNITPPTCLTTTPATPQAILCSQIRSHTTGRRTSPPTCPSGPPWNNHHLVFSGSHPSLSPAATQTSLRHSTTPSLQCLRQLLRGRAQMGDIRTTTHTIRGGSFKSPSQAAGLLLVLVAEVRIRQFRYTMSTFRLFRCLTITVWLHARHHRKVTL